MYRLISIEIYKTSRLNQIYLFFVVTVVFILSGLIRISYLRKQYILDFFFKGEKIDLGVFLIQEGLLWVFNNLIFLYPLIFGLLAYLLGDIEHKASAWKHILTFPIDYRKIFLSKIIVLFYYFTFCVFLNYILLIAFINLFPWLRPDLKDYAFNFDFVLFTILILKIYFCCFGVLIFNFWLSVFLKNWLTSHLLIFIISGVSYYFPHNFPKLGLKTDFITVFRALNKQRKIFTAQDIVLFGKYEYYSFLYGIIISIIGFYLAKNYFQLNPKMILERLKLNIINLSKKMNIDHLFTKEKLIKYLNVNTLLMFAICLFLYFLIYYLQRAFVETDDLLYESFKDKWSSEKLEAVLRSRKGGEFFTAFISTLLIPFKILMISTAILAGVIIMEFKLSFKKILKMTAIFELVYVLAALCKFIWFYFFYDYYTFDDIRNFSFVSLLIFFDSFVTQKWIIYFLSQIDIFLVIYIGLFSLGISIVAKKSYDSALILVLSTYGLLYLIYILIATYFKFMT